MIIIKAVHAHFLPNLVDLDDGDDGNDGDEGDDGDVGISISISFSIAISNFIH